LSLTNKQGCQLEAVRQHQDLTTKRRKKMTNYDKFFSSNVEMLVCNTSCIGVTSKGLLREFRRRFRKEVSQYEGRCRNGKMSVGNFFVVDRGADKSQYRYFAFLPTKHYVDGQTESDNALFALALLNEWCQKTGVKSVAVPNLEIDQDLVKKELCSWTDIRVILFDEKGSEVVLQKEAKDSASDIIVNAPFEEKYACQPVVEPEPEPEPEQKDEESADIEEECDGSFFEVRV